VALTTRLARREFLTTSAALALALRAGPGFAATGGAPLTKAIPSSGERIPVIGMGSWITFDVGRDAALREKRVEVLRTFFDMGGGIVDSSPMYGSSQEVIGYCLG
jgi:hypothetical protein